MAQTHAHDHSHGHGQGHDHGSHYIDQLCTVAVSGALGMIAIVLFLQDSLTILAPFFRYAVFWGGVLLLVMTAIRGVTLWQEVGRPKPAQPPNHDHDHAHDHHHDHDCGHDHKHGPGCDHDHDHDHDHAPAAGSLSLPVVASTPAPAAAPAAEQGHGHAHGDDGHSHGWAPVRYAVLLLPIALFFMGLPNADPTNPVSFNKVYNDCVVQRAVGDLPSLVGVWFFGQTPSNDGVQLDFASGDGEKTKRGEVTGLGFKELAQGAADPNSRPYYEGKTVSLKGQFVRPSSDRKQFSLVRMKMTCCAADAVPLNAVIESPDPVGDIPNLQWVEVTGVVHFRELKKSKLILPVVQLESPADVVLTKPDLSPLQ
jgi:hypothetical protein